MRPTPLGQRGQAMRTWLVEGVDSPAVDRAISSALQRDKYPKEGDPYCMGVRNGAGHVYRHIEVHGIGQKMRVTRILQRLGLVEEDHTSADAACLATFREHAHSSVANQARDWAHAAKGSSCPES